MARILLIETDRLIANNLTMYFTGKGHQVDWQQELQSAIDAADNHTPDIVLLDLMLCGRSGVEFLFEFRSYPDWQEVPAVLYSNISVKDLGKTTASFEDLNVAAYHYKPTTSLMQLAHSIDFILAGRAVYETTR